MRLRVWLSTADRRCFAALLVMALALRLILAPFPGFFGDSQCYIDWGFLLPHHLWDFYSAGARESLIPPNYPPLTIYLFALLDALYLTVGHVLHLSPATQVAQAPILALLAKLPAIAADLGTTVVIYVLARNRLSSRSALIVAACSPSHRLPSSTAQSGDRPIVCLSLSSWLRFS